MSIATDLLEKPPTMTLRERLLTSRLAQVEFAYATKSDELQSLLRSGLSPAKIDQRQFELDALRDLKSNLKHGLEAVAQQKSANVAPFADGEDEDAQQVGPWRSQRAYFENLQRERAKLAPLSRDQWGRAKELSAKRSRRRARDGVRGVDMDSIQVQRSMHPTWFTDNNSVRSYMFAKETLTGVDPCIEAKKVRREVMFAQRTAGIGYRTRHEWKPC